MKSKLLRAVEQTVRKWESNAFGEHELDCPLCANYHEDGEYDKVDNVYDYDKCFNCPVYDTENGGELNPIYSNCPAFNDFKGDEAYGLAISGSVSSCLAIMVYVWGFINFGQDWE